MLDCSDIPNGRDRLNDVCLPWVSRRWKQGIEEAMLPSMQYTYADTLKSAGYVKGRDAFNRNGQTAKLGVKAFSFMWTAVALLSLSCLLYCLAGVISPRGKKRSGDRKSRGMFGGKRSERRGSRGDFSDRANGHKDEYAWTWSKMVSLWRFLICGGIIHGGFEHAVASVRLLLIRASVDLLSLYPLLCMGVSVLDWKHEEELCKKDALSPWLWKFSTTDPAFPHDSVGHGSFVFLRFKLILPVLGRRCHDCIILLGFLERFLFLVTF